VDDELLGGDRLERRCGIDRLGVQQPDLSGLRGDLDEHQLGEEAALRVEFGVQREPPGTPDGVDEGLEAGAGVDEVDRLAGVRYHASPLGCSGKEKLSGWMW
jgi:hypothetical protein